MLEVKVVIISCCKEKLMCVEKRVLLYVHFSGVEGKCGRF
jgi:hypothetical protein